MHGLVGVEDCVAVHAGVDVVKTGTKTKRERRGDASRLKRVAIDATRLGDGAFVVRGGQCRGVRREISQLWVEGAKAEPAMRASTMTTSCDGPWGPWGVIWI